MAIGDAPPPPEPTRDDARPSLVRSAAIGGLVGGAVLVALFGWIAWRATDDKGPGRTVEPTPPVAARETASVERQTARRRLAGWRDAPISALDPAGVVIDGFAPPLVTQPPFDAVDAILFDTLDTRIRLAGLVTVMRDEICLDTERRRFACGLQARASLQNFMRGKTVVCRPLFGVAAQRGEPIEAYCTADGLSLAEHQVRAGFAFPSRPDDAEATAAMEAARAEKLGVWKGNYQIPTADRSDLDAKSVAFGATRPGPPVDPEPAPSAAPAAAPATSPAVPVPQKKKP